MKTSIPIMINGKVKGAIPVNTTDTKPQVMLKAMNMRAVNTVVNTENIISSVYVPGKLFNIITEKTEVEK